MEGFGRAVIFVGISLIPEATLREARSYHDMEFAAAAPFHVKLA
jgi:hypothetical protein